MDHGERSSTGCGPEMSVSKSSNGTIVEINYTQKANLVILLLLCLCQARSKPLNPCAYVDKRRYKSGLPLRTKLIFQIKIILSNLVNVLTIFSIHFAINLIYKRVSFHVKHEIVWVNPNFWTVVYILTSSSSLIRLYLYCDITHDTFYTVSNQAARRVKTVRWSWACSCKTLAAQLWIQNPPLWENRTKSRPFWNDLPWNSIAAGGIYSRRDTAHQRPRWRDARRDGRGRDRKEGKVWGEEEFLRVETGSSGGALTLNTKLHSLIIKCLQNEQSVICCRSIFEHNLRYFTWRGCVF